MRKSTIAFALFCSAFITINTVAATKKPPVINYFKMPLSFEENRGQTAPEVKYLSHGQLDNIFFTPSELVFVWNHPLPKPTPKTLFKHAKPKAEVKKLPPDVLHAEFIGSNKNPEIIGQNKLIAKSNYLIGNDKKKWFTDITNFGRVTYKNLYSGIDATFYGNGSGRFEYDIRVAPNTDYHNFKMHLNGAQKIGIAANGDLQIMLNPTRMISMHKPVIYQEIQSGKKTKQQNIEGKFVLLKDNVVGFEVSDYDKTKELIIDPILYYSTYLGGQQHPTDGTSNASAKGIALDNNNNAYITGWTYGPYFPTTTGSFQETKQNDTNNGAAFVTKYNANGQKVFSTYLSGTKPQTASGGTSIALYFDGTNYLPIITGTNNAEDFPVPEPTYCTCVGNTSGYEQGFVTELDQNGANIVHSTCIADLLGNDLVSIVPNSIAVNSAGNAYITGYTNSPNLICYNENPTESQCESFAPSSAIWQKTKGQTMTSAFVIKMQLADDDTRPLYATYLDSNEEGEETLGNGIVVNYTSNLDQAFITGTTNTNAGFPGFPIQPALQDGSYHAFVARFDSVPDPIILSPAWINYLGGTSCTDDYCYVYGKGIAIRQYNSAKYIYITGDTTANNLPNPSILPPTNAYSYGFISVFNANDGINTHNAYFGSPGNTEVIYQPDNYGNAIAIDNDGYIYIAGKTNGSYLGASTLASKPLDPDMSDYFGIIEKFKDSDPTSTTSDFKLVYSGYLLGNSNENFSFYTDNSITQSIAVSPTGIVHVAGYANTDPVFNIIPLINPDQVAPDSIFINPGPTSAFVTALTPYSINWSGPKHISSTTNVDVFDFAITTNNSDCSDNICIWANTREPNVTKSRTHLLLNATTTTWLACDGTTTNKQFSYFGRDRSNGFANPLAALVPNSLDASAMTYNRPTNTCSSNPLSGVTNTPIAKYLKTSSDNQYYVQYDNTSTTHDKIYVHTAGGWSSAIDIDPTLQSCEFRINAIDGSQTSGKVFAATTNGLYKCANYPQCTAWEHNSYFKKGNISNILYKYDNTTREYLVVATDGDSSSTPYPKAGLFLNTNLNDGKNAYWSNITPKSYPNLSHPEYDTAVEVVTGLAMDKDLLYISSYSIAPAAIKKYGLKRFLPENIKSNQCKYDNADKLANGIIWAGVTVEQLAPDAKFARKSDSISWQTGGTAYQVKRVNFNDTNFDLRCSTTPGEITLPVSITITNINGTTNRANTIYVPALVLGKCNKGCYWVGGADFSKDEDRIN